jgi:protein-arginine kinase activator protein McsA
MQTHNTPTFIEMLRQKIKEEQHKYHDALIGNKEFGELKLIRDNIKKLQSSLKKLINNISGFPSKKKSLF